MAQLNSTQVNGDLTVTGKASFSNYSQHDSGKQL